MINSPPMTDMSVQVLTPPKKPTPPLVTLSSSMYGNTFPRSLGKGLNMDAMMSGAGANDSGVASPGAASTVDDFRNVVLRKTRNSIVQRDIENATSPALAKSLNPPPAFAQWRRRPTPLPDFLKKPLTGVKTTDANSKKIGGK
ncbi:hypothetical protein WR25_03805 [Diploscapter pachys]|uniref:Uncharacterized protein n=1 Tax=Diploscapter pachys TaxID=2018661 RepID=A0A2A2LCQ6_9BILA|nr:hypothetical protein WR25_03805 [Diploscapter pachys]